MTRLLWLLSMALTAVVVGTISAIYATQTLRPTGMLSIGPWEAVRAVGDAAADPFAHAFIASSGQLPPGSAEGMRFVAVNASDGRALIPNCSITVRGEVEFARLWTLSLAQPNGMPLTNEPTLDGLSIHSQDLIYNDDGTFALTIGPRPAAVNALLTRNASPISLVLHTYDGGLAGAPESGASALPDVSVNTQAPGCS